MVSVLEQIGTEYIMVTPKNSFLNSHLKDYRQLNNVVKKER